MLGEFYENVTGGSPRCLTQRRQAARGTFFLSFFEDPLTLAPTQPLAPLCVLQLSAAGFPEPAPLRDRTLLPAQDPPAPQTLPGPFLPQPCLPAQAIRLLLSDTITVTQQRALGCSLQGRQYRDQA